MGVEKLIVLVALFVGVICGVVFITQGQRRSRPKIASMFAAAGFTAARGNICR